MISRSIGYSHENRGIKIALELISWKYCHHIKVMFYGLSSTCNGYFKAIVTMYHSMKSSHGVQGILLLLISKLPEGIPILLPCHTRLLNDWLRAHSALITFSELLRRVSCALRYLTKIQWQILHTTLKLICDGFGATLLLFLYINDIVNSSDLF